MRQCVHKCTIIRSLAFAAAVAATAIVAYSALRPEEFAARKLEAAAALTTAAERYATFAKDIHIFLMSSIQGVHGKADDVRKFA